MALIVPACSGVRRVGRERAVGGNRALQSGERPRRAGLVLRNRPCASNDRTRSFTGWPGLSTSSVGETCSHAAGALAC